MEDDVFASLQAAIQAFWSRRFPSIQANQTRNHSDLHSMFDGQYFREPVSLSDQPTQPTIHDYSSLVSNITETDTEWVYEVEGVQGRSTKADIHLIQNQTDAPLETCLYVMHRFENDIVNAILEIS
jgi:NACalpha-BTF3-like transcription factor